LADADGEAEGTAGAADEGAVEAAAGGGADSGELHAASDVAAINAAQPNMIR
jgi:hypothetical protein